MVKTQENAGTLAALAPFTKDYPIPAQGEPPRSPSKKSFSRQSASPTARVRYDASKVALYSSSQAHRGNALAGGGGSPAVLAGGGGRRISRRAQLRYVVIQLTRMGGIPVPPAGQQSAI